MSLILEFDKQIHYHEYTCIETNVKDHSVVPVLVSSAVFRNFLSYFAFTQFPLQIPLSFITAFYKHKWQSFLYKKTRVSISCLRRNKNYCF